MVHFLPKKLPQLCFPMKEVKQHRRGLLHMIREPPQTSKSSSKKIAKPKTQTHILHVQISSSGSSDPHSNK
jgi:hypothetical protein